GATPFQHAAAVALSLPASYYEDLAASLAERRDLLSQGLRDAGLVTFASQGTYFVTTDAASVGATDGVEFCLGLPERVGVVAEPVGGPSARWLHNQATELGVWVAGSVPIWPSDGARAVNRFLLAGPNGEMERYDKIHPFSYSGEHEHYAAGTERVTFDVEGV